MEKNMNKETRGEILSGAKSVYFAAMLDGWFGEGQKSVKVVGVTGEVTISYSDGDYMVVDRFSSTPDTHYSKGDTMILYKNQPVWEMAYSGQYPPVVIPFLKKSLCEAYKRKEFCGGRGPHHFGENSYMYHNTFEGGFEEFSGRECVVDIIGIGDKHEYGFHTFLGHALI